MPAAGKQLQHYLAGIHYIMIVYLRWAQKKAVDLLSTASINNHYVLTGSVKVTVRDVIRDVTIFRVCNNCTLFVGREQ